MAETRVCVLDREGVVIQESKAASTPEAISDEFHARSGARAGRGAGRGQLKLKNWAFAIAERSTMRSVRIALACRLAIIMHAMLRDGTEERNSSRHKQSLRRDRRPNQLPSGATTKGERQMAPIV
jgi:hypothetical protein